jgi:DNA-binding CsgD family transcriptional regulator
LGRARETEAIHDAIAAGHSVLVAGPLGVGKTRLLEHFLGACPSHTYVAHLVGSEATATIPFGAVASLMPADAVADPYALLQSASDRFVRLSAGRRRLVVIDDIHHLDPSSTAVVHNLCVVRHSTLLAAVRSERPPPAAVTEMLKELHVEWIELGPLSEDDGRAFAAESLGCPPSDPTVDVLLARSGGNPLFLGELVRAQLAGLPGGLSHQLIDLVRARLSGLSTEARRLMECVVVGEPLLARLDVVDDDALAELEQFGLVATADVDGRVVIRGAHPLYGEVVRAGLTPSSRQLVAKRLAGSMRSVERRRGDALRLAGWLLDVGETPDPLLAREAAREAAAWLQTDLADRLMDVALAEDRGCEALMAAAALRRNAGEVRAAERLLREALDVATDDGARFEVALSLAQLYGFYDGNPAAASAVLREVATRVGDGLPQRELEVEAAVFTSIGQYDAALAAAQRLLDDPACDTRAEWSALSTSLWIEVQTMRLDLVDQHVARLAQLVQGVGDAWPGTVDMVWGLEVTVHLERGDLPGGIALGQSRDADAVRLGVPGGLIHFAIAHLRWLSGDLDGARQSISRAIDRLTRFDSYNTLPMVRTSAAMVAAIDGERSEAERLLELADERAPGENPVGMVWRHRANGWLMAKDDPAAAVDAFIEASRVGRQSSTHAWALLALHDAVLFDGADRVIGELDFLGQLPVAAPLMTLLVDHARARAAGDTDAVRLAAESFERAGAKWYAANAWQAVAMSERSAAAQARAATRATLLAPAAALGANAAAIAEIALSPRQAEIAVRAAAGASSRAIAEEMFVSSRTVDNHLRLVYRKLDVNGRAELAAALGLPEPQLRT